MDNNLRKIDTFQANNLVKDLNIFHVESISGVYDIFAEREMANASNQHMTPVLPYQLVKFPASDFANALMMNCARFYVLNMEHQCH